MADGFTSTISFPAEPRDYLPDPTATATALQAQLKDQLGITTTLNPMPFDELVAAADAGKLEDFYLLGARAPYPDAGLLLESHFGPAASLQFGNRFDDVARWLGRGRTGDACGWRMIWLTRHARERVEAGEVQIAWIEETILRPTRTRPDPYRAAVTLSFRAIPEFGGRVLRVAHRSDGDDVLVITAFFDRGARL